MASEPKHFDAHGTGCGWMTAGQQYAVGGLARLECNGIRGGSEL